MTMPLLLALATTAGCLASTPPAVLELEPGPRGHLLLDARLGGRPLRFALDTAASTNVFARSLDGAVELTGDGRSGHGAHGDHAMVPARLDGVSLGELDALTLEGVSMDLGHIDGGEWQLDGLLGLSFLRGWAVELDLGARKLRLYAAGSLDCPAARPFVPGRAGLVQLELRLGGVKAVAVFDTGAPTTIVNEAAWRAMGSPAVGEPPGKGQSAPRTLEPVDVEFDEGDAVSLPVAVGTLPVFRALALAEQPALVLGLDALGRRSLAILFDRGVVALGP